MDLKTDNSHIFFTFVKMNKVYFLKTCSTCSKIMAPLDLEKIEQIEIKSKGISEDQLQEMKNLSGSFESLFSRTAIKYRALGLNEKQLKEEDYKKLILEEYTFLKRPVFILENEIFVGNSKKTVEQAHAKLAKQA